MTGPLGGSAKAKPGEFFGVQALRGLAACMVVVVHSTQMWALKFEGAKIWWPGQAGVDIFFVISGFVMIISSVGKENIRHPALNFLERRMIRIVPLYWIVTLVVLVKFWLLRLNPHLANHSFNVQIPFSYMAASFFFIPYKNSIGEIQPLLAAGWSLSFEMFFYLLFAMALALRFNVIRFLTGTIVSLVLIGLICKPAWPPFWVITQSMMLEFLAGVFVGHLVLNGYRMRPFVSMLIGVGSLTALFLVNSPADEFRVIELGIPAVLLVLCIVMLEGRLGTRLPAWMLTVGDISYSLYLVHMLVIAVAIKPLAWSARSNTWTIEVVTTLGQLFASIAASLLLYKFIERPLTDSLRRRLLKYT